MKNLLGSLCVLAVLLSFAPAARCNTPAAPHVGTYLGSDNFGTYGRTIRFKIVHQGSGYAVMNFSVDHELKVSFCALKIEHGKWVWTQLPHGHHGSAGKFEADVYVTGRWVDAKQNSFHFTANAFAH